MIYHQKESQSVATEPEFAEMVKLANDKFQTLLCTSYTLKVEENMDIIREESNAICRARSVSQK